MKNNPEFVCLCDNLKMQDKMLCVCEDESGEYDENDCLIFAKLKKCNKSYKECEYYKKYEEGYTRLKRLELEKCEDGTLIKFIEKKEFRLSSNRVPRDDSHNVGYFTDEELRYIELQINEYLRNRKI
jgi:hypothetical protein